MTDKPVIAAHNLGPSSIEPAPKKPWQQKFAQLRAVYGATPDAIHQVIAESKPQAGKLVSIDLETDGVTNWVQMNQSMPNISELPNYLHKDKPPMPAPEKHLCHHCAQVAMYRIVHPNASDPVIYTCWQHRLKYSEFPSQVIEEDGSLGPVSGPLIKTKPVPDPVVAAEPPAIPDDVQGAVDAILTGDQFMDDKLKGKRVRIIRVIEYEGDYDEVKDQLAHSMGIGRHPKKAIGCQITIHQGPIKVIKEG